MNKPFDMKIFLAGMLTGAHATRDRHIRQAEAIQATISERWRRENPWTWQRKHLAWFLDHHVSQGSVPTRYYYLLTIRLIVIRLKKSWMFGALKENQYSCGSPNQTDLQRQTIK
jgi:hypothetical protein